MVDVLELRRDPPDESHDPVPSVPGVEDAVGSIDGSEDDVRDVEDDER